MIQFPHLNTIWAKALREHAVTPMMGNDGPYRAIGDKILIFLDAMWQGRKKPLPDIGAMIESGKTVRFWSDPHFEHDNIRKLCNRNEFADVAEMDRVIWANVEQAMAQSDLVVCLGDLSLRNPLGVQRKLAAAFGDKNLHLIGNHDVKGSGPGPWLASGSLASLAFSLPLDLLRSWMTEDHAEMAEVVSWDRLPRQVNFGCSHWPIPVDRLPGATWLNLQGHIHDKPCFPLHVNCSVEAIGYQPRTLRELLTPEIFDDLVRRQSGVDGILNLKRQKAEDHVL